MDKLYYLLFAILIIIYYLSDTREYFTDDTTKNYSLDINGITFNKWLFHRNFTIVGFSKKNIIKIELIKIKGKSMEKEYKIMSYLNKKKCISCPKIYYYGEIDSNTLKPLLNKKHYGKSFNCIIEQFIPDNGKENIADLALTLIEQQKLGVYHCDLVEDNIKYDNSICYLIDYDQAMFLPENVILMPPKIYIKWCDDTMRKKLKIKSYMHNHRNSDIFIDDLLDFTKTTISLNQQTNACDKMYYNFKSNVFSMDGERDFSKREHLLNNIKFRKGEKVLDIGCNLGLLPIYMTNKGCIVDGIDIDKFIINGAKMLANISGKNIDYKVSDIDKNKIDKYYDTITLFSVLHHTKDMENNCKNIAERCNRIIIECRLRESGIKYVNNEWITTSKWKFKQINHLQNYLEKLFPDFSLIKNHGKGDRHRYILEFKKLGDIV